MKSWDIKSNYLTMAFDPLNALKGDFTKRLDTLKEDVVKAIEKAFNANAQAQKDIVRRVEALEAENEHLKKVVRDWEAYWNGQGNGEDIAISEEDYQIAKEQFGIGRQELKELLESGTWTIKLQECHFHRSSGKCLRGPACWYIHAKDGNAEAQREFFDRLTGRTVLPNGKRLPPGA